MKFLFLFLSSLPIIFSLDSKYNWENELADFLFKYKNNEMAQCFYETFKNKKPTEYGLPKEQVKKAIDDMNIRHLTTNPMEVLIGKNLKAYFPEEDDVRVYFSMLLWHYGVGNVVKKWVEKAGNAGKWFDEKCPPKRRDGVKFFLKHFSSRKMENFYIHILDLDEKHLTAKKENEFLERMQFCICAKKCPKCL